MTGAGLEVKDVLRRRYPAHVMFQGVFSRLFFHDVFFEAFCFWRMPPQTYGAAAICFVNGLRRYRRSPTTAERRGCSGDACCEVAELARTRTRIQLKPIVK